LTRVSRIGIALSGAAPKSLLAFIVSVLQPRPGRAFAVARAKAMPVTVAIATAVGVMPKSAVCLAAM
jgi:hypothetical protein